jgi:hypothetical protein
MRAGSTYPFQVISTVGKLSLQQRVHEIARGVQRDLPERHRRATAINYRVALPFLETYRCFNHRAERFPNARRHQAAFYPADVRRDHHATAGDCRRPDTGFFS